MMIACFNAWVDRGDSAHHHKNVKIENATICPLVSNISRSSVGGPGGAAGPTTGLLLDCTNTRVISAVHDNA